MLLRNLYGVLPMRRIAFIGLLALTACQAESLTTPTPTMTPEPEIPLTWAVKRELPHKVEWNGQWFDTTLTWYLLQEWQDPFGENGTVKETVCDVQSTGWWDPVIGNEYKFKFPPSWYAGSRTWKLIANEDEGTVYANIWAVAPVSIGGTEECATLQDSDSDGQPGSTFKLNTTWVHGCYSERFNDYVVRLPADSRNNGEAPFLPITITWELESAEEPILTALESAIPGGEYLPQSFRAVYPPTCQAVMSAYTQP